MLKIYLLFISIPILYLFNLQIIALPGEIFTYFTYILFFYFELVGNQMDALKYAAKECRR